MHLVVVGEGSERNYLARYAEKFGIMSRVHMSGSGSDTSNILSALDLITQASRFEGMPVAVMAAMVASCPVIATNVGGTVELIPNADYGWPLTGT